MEKAISFLRENSSGFLSTVENGKPKVRPFEFMLEEDGKLFFCTSTGKNVYKQLRKSPFAEFCSSNKDYVWIRVSGEVSFSDDRDIKERIINKSPLVKSIYKTPENPMFAIFYLVNGIATMTDFSGNPPLIFKF